MLKKAAVAKANSIKSMFMASSMKKPTEVRHHRKRGVCLLGGGGGVCMCSLGSVCRVLQKDVDLSSDALLGDLLQDLLSEVDSLTSSLFLG